MARKDQRVLSEDEVVDYRREGAKATSSDTYMETPLAPRPVDDRPRGGVIDYRQPLPPPTSGGGLVNPRPSDARGIPGSQRRDWVRMQQAIRDRDGVETGAPAQGWKDLVAVAQAYEEQESGRRWPWTRRSDT